MFQINKTYLFFSLLLTIVLTNYFIQHFLVSEDLLIQHLGKQLSIDRIEHILSFRKKWEWVSWLILPLQYLLKFTFLALWLLCGLVLYNYKTDFRQLFHIVMIAESAKVLPSILMISWFGFIHTNYSLDEIQHFSPFSLLYFFDVSNLDKWLIYPLQTVNLFEIIYVIILAMGIRFVIKKPFVTSLKFTVPVYGLAVVMWIVAITFSTINIS